jgi:hypothetical protein
VPAYRNLYRDYRDYTEWNVQGRRDGHANDKERVRDTESERVPDIEELFDASIRHRFGQLISRAAGPDAQIRRRS